MRYLVGLLCLFLGLCVTAGGGWAGYIMADPTKDRFLDAMTGALLSFFFLGMWLIGFGLSNLEEKGDKEEQ